MKKKYFSLVFIVFVFLAVTLTSQKAVNVMKSMFFTNEVDTNKKPIVIVIDPGHPRTWLRQEEAIAKYAYY